MTARLTGCWRGGRSNGARARTCGAASPVDCHGLSEPVPFQTPGLNSGRHDEVSLCNIPPRDLVENIPFSVRSRLPVYAAAHFLADRTAVRGRGFQRRRAEDNEHYIEPQFDQVSHEPNKVALRDRLYERRHIVYFYILCYTDHSSVT